MAGRWFVHQFGELVCRFGFLSVVVVVVAVGPVPVCVWLEVAVVCLLVLACCHTHCRPTATCKNATRREPPASFSENQSIVFEGGGSNLAAEWKRVSNFVASREMGPMEMKANGGAPHQSVGPLVKWSLSPEAEVVER